MSVDTSFQLEASTYRKRTLPPDALNEPRLRRCRKGTISCWACKKRKVRCNFVKGNSTCDGCKIRGIACISQEFPDEPDPVNSSPQISERLGRVEALLDRVVRKVGLPEEEGEVRSSLSQYQEQCASNPAGELPTPGLTPHDPQYRYGLGAQSTNEYSEICHRLLAVWPDQQSLKAMLDVSGEVLGVCHGTICAPIAKVRYKSAEILQDIMRLPSANSHPVLIARKLLKLATYLQCLSSKRKQQLDDLGIDYTAMMFTAFEKSRRNVTRNEDLVDSIEGLDCLSLEAMYQSNEGNLRGAWHSTRRAMIIAQTMGLHQAASTRSLKALEPDMWTRFDPKYLWFRLMQLNRYLSLMLGMLQGTPNNSFAEPGILDACCPLERMQRLDCVVGGHILQRNEAGLYDTSTTHMIDQQLQSSAACLPASWWAVPDLTSNPEDEMQSMETIIRMMDQLTHFHLVTQLHLPHLLRPHTEHEYDYSKIVATNASREILMRYTTQNDIRRFTSWCRGISLVALISCVAISVAHTRSQRQYVDRRDTNNPLLEILENQHQADRDIMELTLYYMRRTAHEENDMMSTKAASILEDLLSMEAADATCEFEDALWNGTEHGFGCESQISQDGQLLRVHVASFGTLRFEWAIAPC